MTLQADLSFGLVDHEVGRESSASVLHGLTGDRPHKAAAHQGLHLQRWTCSRMPIKRNGEVLGGLQLEGVTFGGIKRNGVLLFSGVPAPPAPERPGIVGQPTLTVINDSEIRVNWDAPTSPGTPLTFYRIRYNDGGGNTLTPQLPVTPRQYTLTGLDASTEYSIQVRAWNAEGRSPSWSTPALATTDAPASTVPHTPAAPTLAAQSTSAIRAEWVAPNDGGEAISSYSIRWRIGSGAYTEQVGLTALAYRHRGAGRGHGVRRVCARGEQRRQLGVERRGAGEHGRAASRPDRAGAGQRRPGAMVTCGRIRRGTVRALPSRDIPNLGDADWTGARPQTADAYLGRARTDAPVAGARLRITMALGRRRTILSTAGWRSPAWGCMSTRSRYVLRSCTYGSSLEPWSGRLSGAQGCAPTTSFASRCIRDSVAIGHTVYGVGTDSTALYGDVGGQKSFSYANSTCGRFSVRLFPSCQGNAPT